MRRHDTAIFLRLKYFARHRKKYDFHANTNYAYTAVSKIIFNALFMPKQSQIQPIMKTTYSQIKTRSCLPGCSFSCK